VHAGIINARRYAQGADAEKSWGHVHLLRERMDAFCEAATMMRGEVEFPEKTCFKSKFIDNQSKC